MNRTVLRVRALLDLGLLNVARVAWYRLSIRLGIAGCIRLKADAPQGPFFRAIGGRGPAPQAPIVDAWVDQGLLFSRHRFALTNGFADWYSNPLTGEPLRSMERPWWRIPDFDPTAGDIKVIWELSRMDWLPNLAQRVVLGEPGSLPRLNQWLSGWVGAHPPYLGPNWKCGQEASIRVLNLAVGALILGGPEAAEPGLIELVRVHLRRIRPTVSYAIAQDNNHGTSEAAALFVGGAWLAARGDPSGLSFERRGRRMLEERIERLVLPDGTFSQYSVNYHRFVLDTLSIVEVWRRRLDRPAFSERHRARCVAATRWLLAMTDELTGEAACLGANDGARLLQLTAADYRDQRPTLQLAGALHSSRVPFGDGPWNAPLEWLGVGRPVRQSEAVGPFWGPQGGYASIERGRLRAIFRVPVRRFRPGHADALHVDLWTRGHAIAVDSGTYSYAADPAVYEHFRGVGAHNTIQFDDRDQMPSLGRFLYGAWIDADEFVMNTDADGATRVVGRYTDFRGAWHERTLRMHENRLEIIDRIGGNFARATMRWHLAGQDWRLEQDELLGREVRISMRSSSPTLRIRLSSGSRSQYYLERETVPVMEAQVSEPAELRTVVVTAEQ